MAKKARTPLPPRPVQAPKRRDTKKPKGVPSVGGQGRSPWLLYGLAALGPVALVAVLLVLFVGGNGSSTKNVTGSAPKIDYATLPGVEKGKAPDQIMASRVKDGVVDRTRPLCPYPQAATYKGTGSINEAANFVCKER